jgi:hypothetical protein
MWIAMGGLVSWLGDLGGGVVGLLNAAQDGDDWIKKIEKDEGCVLIVMQFAVSGSIAVAGVKMELLHDRQHQLEVLEAVKVFLANLRIGRPSHSRYHVRTRTKAQVKPGAINCHRQTAFAVPNAIERHPLWAASSINDRTREY